MIKSILEQIKLSIPVLLICIPFGLINCFLVCYFRESLDAEKELESFMRNSRGGAETLLMISSGIMGWISIVLLEKRLGLERKILLPFALLIWTIVTGGGFALSTLFVDQQPKAFFELIAICLISSSVASLIAIFFRD